MIFCKKLSEVEIKKNEFMIFGERNSGTNYLEGLFYNNFDMSYANRIIWKHWMGFLNHEKAKSGTENILSIGIIRDPIDWLSSMKKQSPHATHMSGLNWHEFLTKEWYSIYDDSKLEISIDRNYITKERYKNILELRSLKLKWLLDPDIPGPYCLVKYEDLRNNTEEVLSEIRSTFGLKNKVFNDIKKDLKHGGMYKKKNNPRPPDEVFNIIKNGLDLDLERKVGYNI